ncbi:hypothetical protein BD410DRAFT_902474 [Rickenella mellea]|uniref:Serine/threonine-protein kinase Tel1 n=1 Tax=Rickenella mellea TaxID=50990 RepID=A0A4Y7PJJ6_9AGAM|nr:hypothetical protein BD410DRAFT_902474 [Rickenella mellea]
MANLKEVLGQLKSDKAKERQFGLGALRELFARDSAVERLDEKGDGRAWLVVFQALFTAVVNERAVVLKKGLNNATPATLRRLEDAASAVRWVTERSVTRLNKKVLKPLLAHLQQTIVHQGQLCHPVALDYVKAMRIVLSYSPHMEHLDTDQWVSMISLSFAVVLGDNLRSSLEDEMDEDEMEERSDDESDPGPATPRKRQRRSPVVRSSTSRLSRPNTVSLEQIECAGVIATLLRSSSAPLLSAELPHLSHNILRCLHRFFVTYPSDTSAHFDMVVAVNATLDHLALNARNEVTAFGVKIWDELLALWGTKHRQMKEGLLVALITLFPYVTQTESSLDRLDGVNKLFRLLNSEQDSRWGIEALSLDALRLEMSTKDERSAFEAGTFRYGFNFTSAQALAWAALELQADCVKELFLLSESTHSMTPSSSRPEGKRTKLENPITALLLSLQANHNSQSRAYHLQSLLFVIDRHWSTLHNELQLEIVNLLLQLVTVDDPTVQSWTFLCFAAVAHANTTAPNEHIPWDAIWSHTMRRTNVSNVSRAACHAAHVLLVCHRLPLHRVLAEVETVAQDIDVQGPSAPTDSVCSFLTECLRVASQDVRLYRMRLEDRVLGWLTENFEVVDASSRLTSGQSRFRMEQRTFQDVLSLLESVCGLAKRSKLICDITLPDCALVELMKSNVKTMTVRNFLLHGQLPRLPKQNTSQKDTPADSASPSIDPGEDLVQPAGRERKVSAFLQKALESATASWEFRAESTLRPAAESLRRTLDLAVLALSFESVLVVNGVRSNRRVLVAACKLICLVVPTLQTLGWTAEEQVLILSGLAPLTASGEVGSLETAWPGLILPGKSTGVKRNDVMNVSNFDVENSNEETARLHLQRIIWQSADVQDAFTTVLSVYKSLIQAIATDSTSHRTKSDSMVIDNDKDDFGPIRTTPIAPSSEATQKAAKHGPHTQKVTSLLIDVLALAPVRQSTNSGPTRNKPLTDVVCDCDEKSLESLWQPFFDHVRQKHLYVSSQTLQRFLDRMETFLMTYAHSRSESVQLLTIRLLSSTTHLWLQEQGEDTELSNSVRALCFWFTDMQKNKRIRSWRIRDSLCHFYDIYVKFDPSQRLWSGPTSEEGTGKVDESMYPDQMLPLFSKDDEMRVRFTAATSCAKLFSASYIPGKDAMTVYDSIRQQLCVKLSNHEHIITRLLCLGNIMIASSSVRRGPYWHLLETCLHSTAYNRHIEVVLVCVAERMGLTHHSQLFESYASQIAYSVKCSGLDFFRIPPHLLGYRDRRDCAEATFEAFSPTNLLAGEQAADDTKHGFVSFERHCQMINKTTADGLLRCFPEIVGYQTVFWMDEQPFEVDLSQEQTAPLIALLYKRFSVLGGVDRFQGLLAENVDRIVFAILCTVGDLDHGRDGPMIKGLELSTGSERPGRAFRAIMKFRTPTDFQMHSPNLPSYSTATVLRAMGWFAGQVPSVNEPATTYHVLHLFFGLIAKTSLVNEQLRLLHCLCIWISLQNIQFKHSTLLRVLAAGATVLLPQPDLTHIAQGLLDWVFIHVRETQCDMPKLSDNLTRICAVAQIFSQAASTDLRALGSSTMDWVEEQALLLGQIGILQKRVSPALAFWPRELTGGLMDLSSNLTAQDLSNILSDHNISSQKFKIVRRLSELAGETSYPRDQFSRVDFWRIKDCIPHGDLAADEIDSFSSLLLSNAGHIRSYGVDQGARPIGSHHNRFWPTESRRANSSPKQNIIMTLLDMLSDHSSKVIHVAYTTLRRLAAIEPFDTSYGPWPSEFEEDISYLGFCPSKESIKHSGDLRHLLERSCFEMCESFPRWISQLTTLLCDVLATRETFYSPLTAILNENEAFAEQILPLLVHSLLRTADKNVESNPRAIISQYFSGVLSQDQVDTKCLHAVVNTVLYLRHFQPDKRSLDALAYNKWLDMDYLTLSRSAISCGAYTTALLFLELAADAHAVGYTNETVSEQILFDIYSHIDEPDGFYGIKTQDLRGFLMRRFHHERQWDKAFQFHGADFEAGDASARGAEGILDSLHSFGFDKLAMTTLQSMGSSGGLSGVGSSDLGYRLGWRTETWDLPESSLWNDSEATLYVALRAVHRERDAGVIDKTLHSVLCREMHRLGGLGNESLVEIRRVTQNLMSLAQIRLWRQSTIQDSLASRNINTDDEIWRRFCRLHQDFDLRDLENIVATRVSLVRSIRQRDQRDQIGDMISPLSRGLFQLEKQCLLQLSAAAREAKQPQIALNSVIRALQMEGTPTFDVSQEFANVLWVQREQKHAVGFLTDLINEDPHYRELGVDARRNVENALILARLGEWTSEACLEKPDDIKAHFISPAVALLAIGSNNSSAERDRAAVFYKCALFAERQYHAIIKSPDLVRLKVYSERKKEELKRREEALRSLSSGTQRWIELNRHQTKAQTILEQDTAQFLVVIKARETYLNEAVRLLSHCLEMSEDYNGDATIRLCSLWFSNFGNDDLNETICAALNRISSRKFVFLAHQLSARLSNAGNPKVSQNQESLQTLVTRICSEHPFHSLYQVYAIRGSDRMSNSRRQSARLDDQSMSQQDRATAAADIFSRVRAIPHMASRVDGLEALCDACLEWSKYFLEKPKKGERIVGVLIPNKLKITKIANLKIPVSTANTPLDPTLRYDNCVWIKGYEPKYSMATGNSRPKISVCLGSDGEKYKQLFKGQGEDDLRQDAVMEQVFELCNQVLQRDRETRKRELRIRSYKVIPLASTAGFLEFVSDTCSMQSWLVSAHGRYRPEDLHYSNAFEMLKKAQLAHQNDKPEILKAFLDIRKRFRPVLRHFFTQEHKNPVTWFEMRLNYSRSVATTSIIGHILGLGDRHISNILLDNVTGEVVHIDLGIAFEQGKILPTPETVPFRLTADMVDGLGLSGTEGVFRRCAEETLRVLRDRSDVIKTVLEVFKYDPLHSWTASAVKIKRVQGSADAPATTPSITETARLDIGIDMESGTEDEAADRALTGVARKLDRALSVEYTVNELIATATDVVNLANLYYGWSPHC